MADSYMTIGDIANRLGVSRSTITAYKARKQMPEPDMQYGRTPLWNSTTIEAWRPRVKNERAK